MVTVRDRWARELERVGWDEDALGALLVRSSGLPGPRANLELAAALADRAEHQPRAAAGLLERWAGLGPEAAPTGAALEMLPFAAVQALGAVALDPGLRARSLVRIRAAVGDPRWRLREAAALALQRVGEREPAVLEKLLPDYLATGDPFAWRAVLATLAHPPILAHAELRALGWRAAERALAVVRDGRGDEQGLRVLSLALAYAPSVLTAAAPAEGFRVLARWAAMPEPAVKKLVVANLRKARLARAHAEECERVALALGDE